MGSPGWPHCQTAWYGSPQTSVSTSSHSLSLCSMFFVSFSHFTSHVCTTFFTVSSYNTESSYIQLRATRSIQMSVSTAYVSLHIHAEELHRQDSAINTDQLKHKFHHRSANYSWTRLAGVTEWATVALRTRPAAVLHITHTQTSLLSFSFPTDVAQSAQGQMGPDMEDIKTS